MRFSKLEIMSGSYMPPFCLRTSLKNLPRSLSRAAAAGMFVTLRFQSTCVRKTAQTFPLVFRLFHGV